MKKRALAILMAVVMAMGMIPTAFADRGGGGTTPSESYYNASDSFGYDSMTSGGTVPGVAVSVAGTTLTEGSASSTTGAAVSNGINIAFDPGYYLESYKIVCGDKYRCQTDAAGNAMQKVGVMSNADKSSITLTAEDGITKTAFGHSSRKAPYWLLLNVKEDTRLYQVTYDWGELSGTLSSDVPAQGSCKVSTVVTVQSPSDAALAEAGRLGYEFVGWSHSFYNNGSFGSGAKFSMPNQNVVLTAIWKCVNINITVTKVWEDGNDQDGLRPDSITVELLDGDDVVGTAQLTTESWSHTFTDLPATGSYSVRETAVLKDYDCDVSGTAASGFTITNFHTPYVTSVTATKRWEDDNNRDGIRPDSIQVQLFADGDKYGQPVTLTADQEGNWTYTWTGLPLNQAGTPVHYTVEETEVPDGYCSSAGDDPLVITNTREQYATTDITITKYWQDNSDQDGLRPDSVNISLYADGSLAQTVTLSRDTQGLTVSPDGDTWTYTFHDLAKYRSGAVGQEIVYTISEAPVDSYTSTVNGFEVTNTHSAKTVTISGVKTWDDHNDQDGLRPDSVTLRLYADGKEIGSAVASARTQWTYTFPDLPAYANGQKIIYTLTEDAVEGYLPSFDEDSFDVTNTHVTGQTSVAVCKRWDDSNNQDGLRPDWVTVTLLANGQKTGRTLTLTAGTGWTGTFTGLDAYADGKQIVYTVAESAVEGYTADVSGNAAQGFTLTNTHTPEIIVISGCKTWDDNNDQDGKRPEAITVNLLANGVEIEETLVTADSQWTYTFKDLPKCADGQEITYTISEDKVEGYISSVNGYNLTNSRTTDTVSFSVTKTWKDSNDKDGIRPDCVTIKLLADGQDTGNTLVLTADNKWSGSFTDLDAYADGRKIVYTVEEIDVKGYKAEIAGDADSGFVITNSHRVSPKTGDNAMPILAAGIAAATPILCAALVKGKRKEDN